MTSKTDAGGTPATVADLATRPQALEPGEMVLIGLTGSARGFRALLRLPGGRIRTVTPGDRVAWGRVVAIDETGVVFHRNGETQRITLPGS